MMTMTEMVIRRYLLLPALLLLAIAAGSAHCHRELLQAQNAISATLAQDTFMYEEDSLLSPSGKYSFWVQGDGNIVIYRGRKPAAGAAVWALDQYMWPNPNFPRPYKLVLQASDGNLVLFYAKDTTFSDVIWKTNLNLSASCGPRGPYTARLTDAGALELVAENGNLGRTVYWSTAGVPPPPPLSRPPPPPLTPATLNQGQYLRELQSLLSPNKKYSLWMQLDGNLVIYTTLLPTAYMAVWSLYVVDPNIFPPPYKAVVRADGKLALLCSQNAVYWSAPLPSRIPAGPYRARLTDAGQLELVAANGVVYWRS
ncbi:hypothetical protein Vretifemale_1892 [Volvox reticuliferus]|nr:hypothetical protein Vretifemale_1892 [Volvox reticuliferus]